MDEERSIPSPLWRALALRILTSNRRNRPVGSMSRHVLGHPVPRDLTDSWGKSAPTIPAFLALCVGIHTLGLAIMLASDAQKHFTLRMKRGLITDGMFRFVRHPN